MSSARHLVDPEDFAPSRPYAERVEDEAGWHDRLARHLVAHVPRLPRPGAARGLAAILPFVEAHTERFGQLDPDGLQQVASSLRPRFRREGLTPALVGESFALVREAAGRSLGKRHYDCQLMAGWGLIQGRLVEMATGEGKTLAASLPVATMALAGYPAHVITVNDYLAQRDAEVLAPLYSCLGLSVGIVVGGMQPDARRAAYASHVTYASNKELAFDYLRDRVAVQRRGSRLHLALEKLAGDARREERLVLRGLWYALVDEADSVFIDEARTPLILSASVPGDGGRADFELALELASGLVAGRDYKIEPGDRLLYLLEAGRKQLAELCEEQPGMWASPRAREELVTQALTAQHYYHRDQHYVVADGKVQIVDESTGRVMPDRSWERGLHQLIETKEGCELTDRRETLARITYQRLFRRYLRLAGMTGTGREVAGEIRSVYRLGVEPVPLNRPSRRVDQGVRVVRTRAEKWRIVADRIAALVAVGRPVLVGTRSVEASEALAAELDRRGMEHALLNAKQDSDEAGIVSRAGLTARITVATNMAGRGTDIELGPGVAEAGGLHVILTEYHESARVDRQLFGRCARQGDPGSCEAIVSLEDDTFTRHAPGLTAALARRLGENGSLPGWALRALRHRAQSRAQWRSAEIRKQNLKLDQRLDRLLAFSGGSE